MKKILKIFPLLLILSGCHHSTIEEISVVAEKTLFDFNIEYVNLICVKDELPILSNDLPANCIVLTKNDNLSHMNCTIESCEIIPCETELCLQKVKVYE